MAPRTPRPSVADMFDSALIGVDDLVVGIDCVALPRSLGATRLTLATVDAAAVVAEAQNGVSTTAGA
jgi:hypothetical protein